MIVALALLALSILGFAIALYFSLVSYGFMSPNQWFIPFMCRMDERTCFFVIGTPEARVFGLPNSVLGIPYHVCTAGIAILLFRRHPLPLQAIVVIVSFSTVLFSIYLAYSLLFTLKTRCILCFTSHIINVFIFILLLVHSDPS
ncbi:MAG: vitamin K epoxide reductase family protein [Ignavibacteriae bacterium]|nr:vitamin K epoxide reductase family protein [Ignavibacteria bacterium]MBI3365397.1 vitamin K epoxide reductase family protein [Ignavibacteriota bacterium]